MSINAAGNTVLTKDLLRNYTRLGRIYPQLVNPQDETLLALSQNLLDSFTQAIGSTREELLENSGAIIAGMVSGSQTDLLISKGLEKLLLDRTEFDTDNEALLAVRQRLLRYTSKLLSCPLAVAEWEDDQRFRQQLQGYFQQPAESIANQLYSDLPPLQTVLAFKPLSAAGLLHRYNCAQIQALLLHCEALTITLWQPKPEHLRQLFQYLRFHQLLARLTKPAPEQFQLQIDGPLSLFYKTQKYGFNLAQFFPALLAQPQWQLVAEIKPGPRPAATLILDQNCGIQSHYQHFNAYIPEEIQWLQTRFSAKITDWVLTPAHDFIALAGEIYCFPDYVVTHPSGTTIAIELFHDWHIAALQTRLQQLQHTPANTAPLILGVAQHLGKTEAIKTALEASPYFQSYGFMFREMPSVERIKPILARLLDQAN